MAPARNWKHLVQKTLGRVILNPLAVRVLMAGLPYPPYSPKNALVMETAGRRSGKRRRTPMGYLRRDESRLWVVAEHGRRADWVRNALAAGGEVRVWIGRRPHEAAIRLLDEDPAAVLARMSRVHRLAVGTLASEPKVVEVQLAPGPR